MTRSSDDRRLSDDEVAAIALLARRGRVLVVLVPRDVSDADVRQLSRDVNARLDELAALRRETRADAVDRIAGWPLRDRRVKDDPLIPPWEERRGRT